MKILITSGGTKVPIDDVRDITNMSKGTFGSKLAYSFLDMDDTVHFFRAIESKSPFKFEMDYDKNPDTQIEFIKWHLGCSLTDHLYTESKFRNFDDYLTGLQSAIVSNKPEIIILAAAVSDYIVPDIVHGKIRSSEQLEIKLAKAEKVISKVKGWCPSAFLVGFKLLVGVSDSELISEAKRSIEQNGCDLVIANDFNSLKAGSHRLLVVSKPGPPDWTTMEEITENQAKNVAISIKQHYLKAVYQ